MEVAHISVWRRDPARFWDFYGQRFAALDGKQPNGAHRALAELERRGLLSGVITQNIDGLHAAAGHARPDRGPRLDPHGLLPGVRDARVAGRDARAAGRRRGGRPALRLRRPLKPDVVLFGELLPDDAMERAQALADGAGLMLVVGSSLEVHPVAGLPADTLTRGGRLAIVTRSADAVRRRGFGEAVRRRGGRARSRRRGSSDLPRLTFAAVRLRARHRERGAQPRAAPARR